MNPEINASGDQSGDRNKGPGEKLALVREPQQPLNNITGPKVADVLQVEGSPARASQNVPAEPTPAPQVKGSAWEQPSPTPQTTPAPAKPNCKEPTPDARQGMAPRRTLGAWAEQNLFGLIGDSKHLRNDLRATCAEENGGKYSRGKIANVIGDIGAMAIGVGTAGGLGLATFKILMIATAATTLPASLAIGGVSVLTALLCYRPFTDSFGRGLWHINVSLLFTGGLESWETSSLRLKESQEEEQAREQRRKKREGEEESEHERVRQSIPAPRPQSASPPVVQPQVDGQLGSSGMGSQALGSAAMGSGGGKGGIPY